MSRFTNEIVIFKERVRISLSNLYTFEQDNFSTKGNLISNLLRSISNSVAYATILEIQPIHK
jgi:hypothetical protein